MKNKNKNQTILTLILLGFFICPKITTANEQQIIITEIAAYLAGDHEWIEIYNPTNDSIDLTDWRFYENETTLLKNLLKNPNAVVSLFSSKRQTNSGT